MRPFAIASFLLWSGTAWAGSFFNVNSGRLSVSAIDKAFGADAAVSEHLFTTSPDSGQVTATRGLSRSRTGFGVSDASFRLNLNHTLTGYADAFAGTGSEITFVPLYDLHYEVSGTYSVTSPVGRPTKI